MSGNAQWSLLGHQHTNHYLSDIKQRRWKEKMRYFNQFQHIFDEEYLF